VTKEGVLAEFELDINNGDPRMGDQTIEDIKNTAKTLIIKDRGGVIEALRYWLNLRDWGLTPIALNVITAVRIPELKPDLESLKVDIESGKALRPYLVYLVDLALKSTRENQLL
jgi:hypothetical protein